LGTLLFIVLVILVLAALLGAGGYSVRRYWSPAGSEVMEASDTTGSGAGAGIAAAILALLVLILLFFGFAQWNWFGTRSGAAPASNPTVTTATGARTGGGTVASPSAMPSPS
jgi:TRAP-type C4-dicarboxylate transport system permease small subunit